MNTLGIIKVLLVSLALEHRVELAVPQAVPQDIGLLGLLPKKELLINGIELALVKSQNTQ